ncbi:hypothetical protein ACFO4N_10205 [Camelliibacillus cellulosilyticus]|uniref:Uncharacterized protein n=1 Tax=Camelliibacillus cellulosilyticus TaxID=2174486 RepID=A0ABV9GR11_9BACL
MLFFIFVFFALIVLLAFNSLLYSLCIKREIPEEKRAKVFQTDNILITVMLLCAYFNLMLQFGTHL